MSAKRRRRRLIKLMKDQADRCHYCRDPLNLKPPGPRNPQAATRDHVTPKALKPTTPLVVAACWWCNNRKGDLHPTIWLSILPGLLADRAKTRATPKHLNSKEADQCLGA